MNIYVHNRHEIETSNNYNENHVIISIYTPGDEPAIVKTNKYTRGFIQLSFADACQPSKDVEQWQLFTKYDAQDILSFVTRARRNDVETVIVHCDAGRSRSPGVAAALAKIYNKDDAFWFKRYTPNSLVYRTILEEFHK